MKFEKISIRNFRNFENIEIGISNKNIFFGLNDIGKTNFLYAMRYVFDKDIRKNGFLDSDFHKKNVEIPIEITVTVDISGFSQYCKILNALKIKWIVKTDNDLRRPRGKSDYVAYD